MCAGASSTARARARTYRGSRQLGVEDVRRGGLESKRRQPLDRVARPRRISDGSTQVEHGREAIVGPPAGGIVEGAPLGPKDALQRLPCEIAEAP